MSKKLSNRQALLNALPHWFLSFLIKEKALSKYVSNTLEYISSDDCDFTLLIGKHPRIDLFIADIPSIMSIIDWSMEWKKTPEGSSYWRDLYRKEMDFRKKYSYKKF